MGSLCFVLLFLCNSQPFVHSRSLPHSSKTTVLDVTASIEKTKRVFSLSPQASLTQQQLSSSASSSLTLQLHSRASVHKPSHSDYKSLTLARLERDSARVRSLTTRLDLAVNGIAQSELHPVQKSKELRFGVEELQGPIISLAPVREVVSTSPESESVNRRVRLTWCSTPAVTSHGYSANHALIVTSKLTPSSSQPPRLRTRRSRARALSANPWTSLNAKTTPASTRSPTVMDPLLMAIS
ncbi:hypothetical protein L6164_026899 [Bauhinia variegata]|uniref:Uncharacterized protein n=1 Tax=Bauhinia variegata TaxID=167791 RepID=A0ACB9LRV0_BAUVA|nr:hypothetical protein L6164_026899 [Bauhinia variegata]